MQTPRPTHPVNAALRSGPVVVVVVAEHPGSVQLPPPRSVAVAPAQGPPGLRRATTSSRRRVRPRRPAGRCRYQGDRGDPDRHQEQERRSLQHRDGPKAGERQPRSGAPLQRRVRSVPSMRARTIGSSGGWPTALGQRASSLGHSPGVVERPAQKHLELGIEAAELIGRPLGQRVMDGGINSQQDLLAVIHRSGIERPGVDDR